MQPLSHRLLVAAGEYSASIYAMIFTTPLAMMRPDRSISYFFCTLLVLCQLLTPALARAATASSYSIVLASAPGKNLKWTVKKNPLFKGRTVYVQRTTVKGAPWERLCIGYFDNRQQAAAVQKKIRTNSYPGAWVQKTSTKNIVSTMTGAAVTPGSDGSASTAAKTPTRAPSKRSASSTLTEKQLDSLMQRAMSDFNNKKYSSSIRYLNALLAAGKHKYSRKALEYQGLARQRKGQKTRAAGSYKKYLRLYPDGDGSERVSQRLAGLLTETAASRKKIRMTTKGEQGKLISHGSFSQFYQNHKTTVDNAGSITDLSQLITFIDLNSQYKSTKFDHRIQFTADHTNDFIKNRNGSEFRFIEAYYETAYRRTGSSGRFGRQRLQVGGILQRFDGVTLGYQFNPNFRLNFLGGFPVDVDDKTSINKHKKFYGFTFETGTFLRHWNMNLFYFDQSNDGLDDRNSAGTELRYRDRNKSLFGLLDYDLLYDEINTLRLNGYINFARGRTAYMNVFLQQSPLLTTANALIGRQEQSLEELKKVLNIEQIYQLARDRTASRETVTVGGTQVMNKTFQMAADITFLHTGDTVASGGVAATLDTGTDYYLNTQLIASSLLMKNDSNVFGVRYYNTDPSNIVSFIANSRFPVSRNWRVNPRLQYDIRQLKSGESRKLLRAIFRTDYRYRNDARFDFEVGHDKNSGETVSELLGSSSFFFTLGYRWDF